jgi:hypothetical protein
VVLLAIQRAGHHQAGGQQVNARVVCDMPAREYHADADGPRLSQSLATLACCKSPLHAWNGHPLLGRHDYAYEAGDDDGTLIHSLILEPDSEQIAVLPYENFRTKAAQVERDHALAAGLIPIVSGKLGAFQYKAKAISQRFADQGLEFHGESEVVIYWEEQTPFGPVRCRARLDHLIVESDRITVVDLKTCESAHPLDIQAVCWRKGYDIQRAAYVRAVEAAFPNYGGRVDYQIAFCELEKPYATNVVALESEFARAGELRWERGRDRWTDALVSDHWAGYTGGAVNMPAWAKSQELGE